MTTIAYLGYWLVHKALRVLEQQPVVNGLKPERNLPVTCSLVVLARKTRTIWNPVKPKIGTARSAQNAINAIAQRFGGDKISFPEFLEKEVWIFV